MSDYKTRDMLLRENELLRGVIEAKNELLTAYEIGLPAAQERADKAKKRLAELKQEMSAQVEVESE